MNYRAEMNDAAAWSVIIFKLREMADIGFIKANMNQYDQQDDADDHSACKKVRSRRTIMMSGSLYLLVSLLHKIVSIVLSSTFTANLIILHNAYFICEQV